MLLKKYYNFTVSIDGLQETIEEMLMAEDSSPDDMLKMILEAQQWCRYLESAQKMVLYYLGFFEIKHSMVGATKDEAKEDIKKGTSNSRVLAKRCKIEETEPEKILEAANWILKTSNAEIRILKKFAGELGNYAKLMKAKYFSFSYKYKKALSKI